MKIAGPVGAGRPESPRTGVRQQRNPQMSFELRSCRMQAGPEGLRLAISLIASVPGALLRDVMSNDKPSP